MEISELFSVRDKTALVTGGTSGIGAMIVEGLLRAGAKVHTCARRQDGIDATLSRLGGLGRLHGFCADVGTEAGVIAIRDELARLESKLHILINNVGATHRAPLEEYPRSEFERVVNINLIAPFDVTRRLLPLLRAAASVDDPARVVNISSVGAHKLMAGINNFAYSASKAGLMMMTRHTAAEVVKDHITVNCVAPGLFESKLSAYMFDPSHPQYKFRPTIPIDRPGYLEDIVGAVLYLCSRAGSFVTGNELRVSGGQSTIDWGV
jgi:NAD(P)-dependent dehydrogenase (short-subunit alcohol dehydrogenase family)